MAVTFVEGAVIFIGGAVIFIDKEAVMSIKGAVTSIGEAVMSIGKRSLAVEKLFKIAGVKVGDIKGVNKHDLRWRLIIYKLKGPFLLKYSLISVFNYSVGLSL